MNVFLTLVHVPAPFRVFARVCVRARLCTRACNVNNKSYIENNATVIVTVLRKQSDQLRSKLVVPNFGVDKLFSVGLFNDYPNVL